MKASFLKRVRWVPALAAAAALSLVGVGISTPADAAVGNINPDTPSSLTIHKYDGDQQERKQYEGFHPISDWLNCIVII